METKVLKINSKEDSENINIAASYLSDGKLVVIPTETVYGLGANGLNEEAVKNIFVAKGRPQDNPLILHVAEKSWVSNLVTEIPDVALKVMDKFWPGPLTIIFNKSDLVPSETSAGLSTVAIRMPSHEVAREIIRASGVPVAAPSANISGRPSPTKVEHVIEDLMGKVDVIVDSGHTDVGIESTVLDVTVEPPVILRPGGVTFEELQALIPDLEIDTTIIDPNDKTVPKSPGQKYRHYSPKADAILFGGNLNHVVKEINKRIADLKGEKSAVLATEQTYKDYVGADLVINLGSRENLEEIAKNIFDALRECDEEEVDIIYVEGYDLRGIGQGIMNRLLKACGGKVVLGL